MWHHIERIFYVNLDYEHKRNRSFLDECARMGVPLDKVERVEAVHNPLNGYAGSCLSHIEVLDRAIKGGYSSILVCEDDIRFKVSYQALSNMIENFIAQFEQWDVLLLGGERYFTTPTHHPSIHKADAVTCSDCTWIRSDYIPKLKRLFEWTYAHYLSKELLATESRANGTPIDNTWTTLQKLDQWYCLHPHPVDQHAFISASTGIRPAPKDKDAPPYEHSVLNHYLNNQQLQEEIHLFTTSLR